MKKNLTNLRQVVYNQAKEGLALEKKYIEL